MGAGERAFRVLHVSDYAAAYEGAFIRQLRMLDDELRGRGAAPSAFALTPAALVEPWAHALALEGWTLADVAPSGTRGSHAAVHALFDAVREVEPDVVHVHFGTYDLAARAALLRLRDDPRFADTKLVWHYRTALETPVAQRSAVRRVKDYLKFVRASRDVDLVVGVTNALADEAVARGVAPARARGVVAGCDTETFRADPASRARVRAELGLEPDDILLLHMGWSWHRKGGDLLAAALDQLTDAEGRTPAGKRIVAASIGAPDDVDLGRIRRLPMSTSVHEYHQAADIFVSASRSEGFGNGLVEAMACARVAVAAAADGQIETFAGLPGVTTVAIDSATAIVDGVTALLDQQSRWGELGASNRAHVERHHSMRRWAAEMADTYAELLPSRLPASDAGATTHSHAALADVEPEAEVA
ncbi:MAG: glycosyl transferase [Thermoleophilia bacterium]|nr:glycosyl transferase [Thermoleophilia bacterium]